MLTASAHSRIEVTRNNRKPKLYRPNQFNHFDELKHKDDW